MSRIQIDPGYWHDRLEINAKSAIFHQWQQLEASGCIENFRIAAGESSAFREGWFFSDSDAYKWLEAAARISASHPDPMLDSLIEAFITLIRKAQQPDGYLFTYNQIFFPGTRWQNLQIEHELYCHGHLIEAGVSHFEASGRQELLEPAILAAELIAADFAGKGPAFTPGHEEIEIALLRLHQAAPHGMLYLDLARQFLERRGKVKGFAISLLRQNANVNRRSRFVVSQRADYLTAHPDSKPFSLPPGNTAPRPPGSTFRWAASALSGKFFQQHTPINNQIVPVGHSVRFTYLETAIAMFSRLSGDQSLVSVLENAWEHMVTRRMYVTGGLGSVPAIEGFGRDYELDPELAYAETCAALGCLFWNQEMALLCGKACYADLFEWQLYNAASPGMGLDGKTYLYNNPLSSRGLVTRQPWYAVPCCPSNLSRTWAYLGKYVYTTSPCEIHIQQYFDCVVSGVNLPIENGNTDFAFSMRSGLPWDGHVSLRIEEASPAQQGNPEEVVLSLRQPSWASTTRISLNGDLYNDYVLERAASLEPTASGYDPRRATYIKMRRVWTAGDTIELDFDLSIQPLRAHPSVRGHAGKVAITCGPLVYCLESIDNPGVDLSSVRVDTGTLKASFDASMLGGIICIEGRSKDGSALVFIPYFLWGNRGPSSMIVWVYENS